MNNGNFNEDVEDNDIQGSNHEHQEGDNEEYENDDYKNPRSSGLSREQNENNENKKINNGAEEQ